VNKLIVWLEDQSNRARIYATAVVLIPLLVGAGYLTSGTAATVLNILAALTGAAVPALARKHTPKERA
jgi:hypothetical protein